MHRLEAEMLENIHLPYGIPREQGSGELFLLQLIRL